MYTSFPALAYYKRQRQGLKWQLVEMAAVFLLAGGCRTYGTRTALQKNSRHETTTNGKPGSRPKKKNVYPIQIIEFTYENEEVILKVLLILLNLGADQLQI